MICQRVICVRKIGLKKYALNFYLDLLNIADYSKYIH